MKFPVKNTMLTPEEYDNYLKTGQPPLVPEKPVMQRFLRDIMMMKSQKTDQPPEPQKEANGLETEIRPLTLVERELFGMKKFEMTGQPARIDVGKDNSEWQEVD